MKFLLLTFSLAFSINSFSQECKSVDLTISEYNMGFSSVNDISKAIECNLNKNLRGNKLCNTKVGLKKDQLVVAKNMLAVGLLAPGDVEDIEDELSDLEASCK